MEFFEKQSYSLSEIKQIFKEQNLPLRDVEVVLCDLLSIDRTTYQFHDDAIYDVLEVERLDEVLQKMQSGMPVEYITEKASFWKHTFTVSESVLIPRPETELIIEKVLEYYDKDQSLNILDLGTGSGILAISLAAEFPKSAVKALDISRDALQIAKSNADRILDASDIQFIQSDWYQSLGNEKFDLIVSNPPYITLDEYHGLEGKVRGFEPRFALTDDADGLAHYRIIASHAELHLNRGAHIMVEHGEGQSSSLNKIFIQNGFQIVENVVDLSQKNRILIAKI